MPQDNKRIKGFCLLKDCKKQYGKTLLCFECDIYRLQLWLWEKLKEEVEERMFRLKREKSVKKTRKESHEENNLNINRSQKKSRRA